MSRDTGWYRCYDRDQCKWVFREFDGDGEWVDCGQYLSEREFKIIYDVPEQILVNPVPADEVKHKYYAIVSTGIPNNPNLVGYFSDVMGISGSLDFATRYESKDDLITAITDYGFSLVEIKVETIETRVVKEGEN